MKKIEAAVQSEVSKQVVNAIRKIGVERQHRFNR